MKTLFTRLSIVAFAFLFFNCSSDSDSSDDQLPVAKTKVGINRIEVNLIPTSNWDFGSNPDLYVAIHDHTTSSAQLTSPTFWDISLTPTTPFAWLLPANQTSNLTAATMTVQVFDNDTDDDLAGDDDFVGEVFFRISDYTSGSDKYPPMVYKVTDGVMVSMYLTWE